MHLSKLIIPLALSVALAAPAQQTKKLTAEKHNEYGLVYSLPQTQLSITLTLNKTVETAGPFCQYAKKYLGTDRVVAEDRTAWSIIDVKVTPFGVADTSQQYLMQLKPGSPTYISVTPDGGMICAINAETRAPQLPVAESMGVLENTLVWNPDEYLQYVGEDFLSSQSMSRRAQMLAESIMEVRDAKIALTRGTADNMPSDGEQLSLMLKSLAHQEETMTRAFTGHTYSEQLVATYIYTPEKEGKSVLMRLSAFDGPTTPDDYAGEPLYVSLKITQRPQLPRDEKGEEKKIPKDAVIYRIPGEAAVTLSYRARNIWEATLPVAQFGVDFGVSPTLFTDRKTPSFAIFNPVTGFLEEIGAVSELEK